MRICHSLLGECIDVRDEELQWRKPVDVIQHYARERWLLDADDLIVLAKGGLVISPSTAPDELGHSCDIFVFLRSDLGPAVSVEEVSNEAGGVTSASEEGVDKDDGGEGAAEEESSASSSMVLPAGPGASASSGPADDPALETLHSNIVEARRRLGEVGRVLTLASKLEARLGVQRLAVQAVLDNLASHRATCTRSMDLLRLKHDKVQGRFDLNIGHVEESIVALREVHLHPALRSPGMETLADVLPQEKIMRFTAGVQAETARLAQRLEKLHNEDVFAQKMCDQVATKIQDHLQDDDLRSSCSSTRLKLDAVMAELVPALKSHVPQELGVPDPVMVLEEERRTAGLLADLVRICQDIRIERAQLHARWQRQKGVFLQRLWEVSCAQSKVRGVERQAALLEEAINSQHNHAQQLSHLQKMPRAYHKALGEVDRRRQFKARYMAQVDQARAQLRKMAEDENDRRRTFFSRHGCHLPVDLVRGLHSLAPPVSIELADFDMHLPETGSLTDQSQSATSASTRGVAGGSMRQSGSSTSPTASSAFGGLPGGAVREENLREADAHTQECEVPVECRLGVQVLGQHVGDADSVGRNPEGF